MPNGSVVFEGVAKAVVCGSGSVFCDSRFYDFNRFGIFCFPFFFEGSPPDHNCFHSLFLWLWVGGFLKSGLKFANVGFQHVNISS